jgi:hypothetical protein
VWASFTANFVKPGGGSLALKKYKHACFMFELCFAVALKTQQEHYKQPNLEVAAKAVPQKKYLG